MRQCLCTFLAILYIVFLIHLYLFHKPYFCEAFFEANSYEDAIRNAISIGGDSDTLAAITGAVAEAYFGIPEDIKTKGISYLDDKLKDIVNDYYANLNK